MTTSNGDHNSPSAASIPVIDIRPTNPQAAAQLLAAASTDGFVYIENNDAGVPISAINDIFSMSKQFFDLPVEVKEQAAIKSNKAGSNVGWLKQGVEKLDPATQKKPDVKEAVNIGVPLRATQVLAGPLHPYRDTITSFDDACEQLCLRILTLFAKALSIPDNWFTSKHDRQQGDTGTTLRILYYPALNSVLDTSVEDIRAGAHSDFGSITLLFQLPGQPGLEIKTATGAWVSVPVDPTGNLARGESLPILVNIGDLLEDWTAGLLKSTVHRVVFPAKAKDATDRYSVAYFCHPLDEVVLDPVPSVLVEERRKQHNHSMKAITAREHLMNRLAATYTITK